MKYKILAKLIVFLLGFVFAIPCAGQERIYDVVHLSIYKIEVLGENSIKELFGYINNEDIPTCNQRMLHSMQWLGFGKL